MIEINNPLNIRPGQPWQGIIGVKQTGSGEFIQFVDVQHCFRVGSIILQDYKHDYGAMSLEDVTGRWAPLGDGANNPTSYAVALGRLTGFTPTEVLNLDSASTQLPILRGMCNVENGNPPTGQWWYADDVIMAGIRLNLGVSP